MSSVQTRQNNEPMIAGKSHAGILQVCPSLTYILTHAYSHSLTPIARVIMSKMRDSGEPNVLGITHSFLLIPTLTH
jgi:hypothetical protein